MTPVEREFQLGWIKLAAREWGKPGGIPVMAIHGWMDNAASFDVLAPLLSDCHIIAIDTAGHGFSDHLPASSVNNIWSDIADLFTVADQLGWDEFSIIGHSRGANVGVLMAGTFPERIKTLTLLDGGSPLTTEAKDMPAVLAKSVGDKQNPRQPTKLPTREAVLALRNSGRISITPAQAESLGARGISEKDGDFYWHADQKLKATSELHLTPSLLQAFYESITAPVLAVFAKQGFAQLLLESPLKDQISKLELHQLDGKHHFHMGAETEQIALLISGFYASNI